MKKLKAQVNMIAVVLILVVFLILALFLASSLQTIGLNERINFYTNNLLISFLKTDTGHTANPQQCQTMSNLIYCSVVTPHFQCGGNPCDQEALTLTDVYLSKATEKSGFDYYFVWGDKKSGNEKILSGQTFKTITRIEKKQGVINATLYIGKV